MQYAVRERYLRPGESIGIPSVNLFEPSDLKFTNLTEGAILSLDGRRGEYQLGYGDEVCFVWDSPLQVLTQKPEHL